MEPPLVSLRKKKWHSWPPWLPGSLLLSLGSCCLERGHWARTETPALRGLLLHGVPATCCDYQEEGHLRAGDHVTLPQSGRGKALSDLTQDVVTQVSQ